MSESQFIDTSVGRLAVTTQGAGAPAVLWNSLFVDARSWQRVTEKLAELRRLVVITGPGHGKSSDPGRRYDQIECARAAAEVLDTLGSHEPVDWVGNAWGGHVGLRFAVAYPNRIRSLVTLGTPVQSLSTAERVRMATLLQVHRIVGPVGFISNALVETMLSPATRAHDPEAVALLRDCFTRADRKRLRNAIISISLHREDLTALLPEVAVPTMMVTGEQHTGWTPDAAAAAVKSLP